MSSSLITVENVSFRYNDEAVLEHINLSIEAGDFLGLIGPNGSGKTTLLKIMIGLLKPIEGRAFLFGQPVESFTQWHKIGYVAQKAGLVSVRFPISVVELVGMGGGGKRHIRKALEAVGMEEKQHALIAELSGGQQQRVFIARALVSHPELLILDEPTVGVDVDSQIKFYELLKRLNEERNLTLLLVSHDVSVVAHEVKTVACINKTLICHGNPHQVLNGDFIQKLYGKHLRMVVHEH